MNVIANVAYARKKELSKLRAIRRTTTELEECTSARFSISHLLHEIHLNPKRKLSQQEDAKYKPRNFAHMQRISDTLVLQQQNGHKMECKLISKL